MSEEVLAVGGETATARALAGFAARLTCDGHCLGSQLSLSFVAL